MFMLLRLLVSDGNSVGTAQPLLFVDSAALSVLRQFCQERSGGLFLGFTFSCGMSEGRRR